MFERQTFRQLGFWAAIFLIVATSAVAYVGLERFRALNASVDHTQSILFQLEHVNLLLNDAQTGQRGFIISGEEAFLDPYRAALTEAVPALAELRRLTTERPHLGAHLAKLDEAVKEHLSVLARTIPQRRVGGIEGVDRALIARSRELAETTRAEIGEMSAAERRMLRIEEVGAQRQGTLALTALVAGTVVSVVAIICVFLITMGEVRRRQRAELQLVELNADLEQRVEARTAELAQTNKALQHEIEQRQLAAEKLRETNDRLMAIIGASPVGIFLLDTKGQIVVWNLGASRIFGYSRSEMLGHQPPFLQEIDPSSFGEASSPGGPPRAVDLDLPRQDGKVIHVRLFTAPIFAGEKQREQLYIVEDITEQRSIEQQLRQSQKMETIGQLTGGIAHDFNNLLTIILGNIDIAQERSATGGDIGESLQLAMKGAMRGAELTQRLLAFARKQPLEPRSTNLTELVSGTVVMLRRMLGAPITVSVHTEQALWPAMVDPSQVEDAIVNLAVNARDAMPNGGQLAIETANVTLDADYVSLNPNVTPGDYVMLSVGDTGVGISAEILDRVFEPFFTTKDKNKGTGLGLSMVYGLIKQSEGHIKIYSEPGHGTTVRMYLPRAGDGAAKADESGRAAPITMAPGKHTVLTVEDNPDVRNIAVRMLRDIGYDVVEADTAATALDILRVRDDIDVLFTDIVMPGGRTGYDLAQEATRMHPELRVLFTSGYSEMFIKLGAAGINGHRLSKPYRKLDLAAKLQAVLTDLEPFDA